MSRRDLPVFFSCGSDATRKLCRLTEACTPNMSKRMGRRRGGIVKRRVCVSAEAIILVTRSGAHAAEMNLPISDFGRNLVAGGN